MAGRDTELNRMNQAIADFCAEVVSEPLCYFSEADLQGILFARLVQAFPAQVETSFSRGPDAKGKYRTGMVHREYGATAGRRTDISVFATEDLAAVDGPALKVQGQYMKPRFAVELGTEKTTNTAAHIASDLDKPSRARERGYLIHFFRDVKRADPGTPLRAKTEEKLERIFRRHACAAEPPSHVKSLCFVLRLARSSKTIRGKCELLVPDTGIWRRVNLKRVREDVLALLEVSDSNLTTGST